MHDCMSDCSSYQRVFEHVSCNCVSPRCQNRISCMYMYDNATESCCSIHFISSDVSAITCMILRTIWLVLRQ